MEQIDNIKNLFKRVEDKRAFYEAVAENFGLSVSSVRTGWFSRFEIPKKYSVQEKLIVLMQNWINHQNEKISQ